MKKILIIKLGASGDVLRTLPLAKKLKDKNPSSELTWVTKGDIVSLLTPINYIDKAVTLPFKANQKFDEVYNFDLDEEALNLMTLVSSEKKYGFHKEGKYASAYNSAGEYYLNTMFDDEVKKSNKKTYQEMMFDIAELQYSKERYSLIIPSKDLEYAKKFSKSNGLQSSKLIGIHMGASPRWPSKAWSEEHVEEFITLVLNKGYQVILFGGPDEISKHESLVKKISESGLKIFRNNPTNTKGQFVALLNLCTQVVCSDSLAMHASVGLGKKTIALFFCTSPNEVESYGLVTKIISPMLEDFFPERSDEYNEELINSISPEKVLSEIK
ncbi:MAG: glycosyltransferase family 9 protein [Nanoarchaeota archaeon]